MGRDRLATSTRAASRSWPRCAAGPSEPEEEAQAYSEDHGRDRCAGEATYRNQRDCRGGREAQCSSNRVQSGQHKGRHHKTLPAPSRPTVCRSCQVESQHHRDLRHGQHEHCHEARRGHRWRCLPERRQVARHAVGQSSVTQRTFACASPAARCIRPSAPTGAWSSDRGAASTNTTGRTQSGGQRNSPTTRDPRVATR